MNKIRKVALRLSLVPAAMFAAAAAHAEGVDISAAVSSATSDITKAGVLIVGVVVAVAAFSWIRRVIK